MHWFRTNLQPGWLALFALAVQFTLSIGHVHTHGFVQPLLPNPACSAVADATGEVVPAAPAPVDGSDDCLVCLTIYLTGTSPTSAGPTLPVPVEFAWIKLAMVFELPLTAAPHHFFNARAPPLTALETLTAISPNKGEAGVACRRFLDAQSMRL